LQDRRNGLEPAIGSWNPAVRCSVAAAVVGQGGTLQAQSPVISLAVAQGQTFCQVPRISFTAEPSEASFPGREGINLGVVPTAFVALISLLGRHQRVAAAPCGFGGRLKLHGQHQGVTLGTDGSALSFRDGVAGRDVQAARGCQRDGQTGAAKLAQQVRATHQKVSPSSAPPRTGSPFFPAA
jgi:hypothetical protein